MRARSSRRSSLRLLAATSLLPLASASCGLVLGIDDVPGGDGGAGDGGASDATAADALADVTTGGPPDGAPEDEDDASDDDGSPASDASDAAPDDADGSPGATSLFVWAGEVLAPSKFTTSGVGFGSAIAFSNDGKWLAVGFSDSGQQAGAVAIYTTGDGGWELFGTVSPTTMSTSTGLDPALAFDSEGGLAVGDPGTNAVYDCMLIAGLYTCPTTYASPTSVSGTGTALAYDGNDILYIGGPGGPAPGGASTEGAVEIVQTKQLSTFASHPDGFGTSLAVAGGNIIVGAPGGSGGVYVGSAASAGTLQHLSDSDAGDGGSLEGTAVALTADGGVALAGAPGENRVYGFSVPSAHGGTVSGRFVLEPPASYTDQGSFGASLATSTRAAAVGACTHDRSNGAVYIYPAQATAPPFVADGGAPLDRTLTADRAQFGKVLAFSPDGTLAVGAPAADVGHVYLYRATDP